MLIYIYTIGLTNIAIYISITIFFNPIARVQLFIAVTLMYNIVYMYTPTDGILALSASLNN